MISNLNYQKYRQKFDQVDRKITGWMAQNGMTIMRVGLGIVFFWFGALKLFPGLSPAEALVAETITFIPAAIFQPLLAVWEMAIGIGLIAGIWMRVTLLLMFLQMMGTASPLVLLPGVVWTQFPFVLTLEGQYIIKNLVLIGAGLVLGGTVRGGRFQAEAAQSQESAQSKVQGTA